MARVQPFPSQYRPPPASHGESMYYPKGGMPTYPSPRPVPAPRPQEPYFPHSPANNASAGYQAQQYAIRAQNQHMERYEPYRRPATQALPPPSPQPRLMPSQGPLHSPQRGQPPPHPLSRQTTDAKAYETTQPTGRYQQSRGAQRDARWNAKYADRGHRMGPIVHGPPPIPPPHPGQSAFQGIQGQTSTPGIDRLRAEQQAAIAAARRAHAESVRLKISDDEQQRKLRRIQLQVYVHARPTPCSWEGCQALLNSWALLEKHLVHAHLSPSSHLDKKLQIKCEWLDCQKTFETTEHCYQHCLVDHMGGYSARCPFNCLYEGPEFSELMAHIGRRHPNATPDDFVPGLIHHKPIYLPESVADLPKLPQMVALSNMEGVDDLKTSIFLAGDVKGHCGGISEKVQKQIRKGCIGSGRRPRKDHFVDMEAAKAAVEAMIENSKRLLSPDGPYETEDEAKPDSADVSTANTGLDVAVPTINEAKPHKVVLIDIKSYIRKAKERARKLISTDQIEPEPSTESSTVSRSSSRSGSNPPRPRLMMKISGLKSKLAQEEDQTKEADAESTASESDSASTVSAYSMYDGGRARSATEASDDATALALKRSLRLKRKAEGILSSD